LVDNIDSWASGIFLLISLVAIFAAGSVLILFISWMLTSLINFNESPKDFKGWVVATFSSSSKKIKVFLTNVFFHFVVLGFVVKLLVFPTMPDLDHWLTMLIMMMFMNPIAQFYFGWEMRFKGVIPADAPKYKRVTAVAFMIAGYIFMFLSWVGVIERLPR